MRFADKRTMLEIYTMGGDRVSFARMLQLHSASFFFRGGGVIL